MSIYELKKDITDGYNPERKAEMELLFAEIDIARATRDKDLMNKVGQTIYNYLFEDLESVRRNKKQALEVIEKEKTQMCFPEFQNGFCRLMAKYTNREKKLSSYLTSLFYQVHGLQNPDEVGEGK